MDALIAFLKDRIAEDEKPHEGTHRCEGGDYWIDVHWAGRDESGNDVWQKNDEHCRPRREAAVKRALMVWVRNRWSGWPDDCDVFLKVLAAAYADHADYREEWAPS